MEKNRGQKTDNIVVDLNGNISIIILNINGPNTSYER